MEKTLFLSIGHNWGKNTPKGTPDQGATGNGTTEAKEAKRIVDAIVAKGIPGLKLVKVPEKLSLAQRIKWVNSELAFADEAMAMEFHLDSFSATSEGASTWYDGGNAYTLGEGKQFLAEYTRVTGLRSRHVNPDTENRLHYLAWVSEVKCASLLIELGFISNPKELAVIRAKGVEAVIAGIVAMNAK